MANISRFEILRCVFFGIWICDQGEKGISFKRKTFIIQGIRQSGIFRNKARSNLYELVLDDSKIHVVCIRAKARYLLFINTFNSVLGYFLDS